jgi:hypothetical protein
LVPSTRPLALSTVSRIISPQSPRAFALPFSARAEVLRGVGHALVEQCATSPSAPQHLRALLALLAGEQLDALAELAELVGEGLERAFDAELGGLAAIP